MIGISGSLIWSKTLTEPIFNPVVNFGEVRTAQLANPSLSSPPSWWPWDLFRYFKVCSDAKQRVGCGKQREATAPIQSPINCSLGSCACGEGPALGQNTLMMMMMMILYIYILILLNKDKNITFTSDITLHSFKLGET